MSELRLNKATREWVILAPQEGHPAESYRLDRPPPRVRDRYATGCAFCPDAAPIATPTFVLPGEGGQDVRIFPVSQPSLSRTGEVVRTSRGIFRHLTGYGYHEDVVETPRHDLSPVHQDDRGVANILKAYRLRYREIQMDSKVGYVVVFKNHGGQAGSSQEHPHSQIIATPVVPADVRQRVATAETHFDDDGVCVYCQLLAEELAEETRIIYQNEAYVAHVPYAAYSPFHVWIMPRRHSASFADVRDDELPYLALCLRAVLVKIYVGLNDPNYSYVIRSAPESSRSSPFYHWYLSIVPRLAKTGGFELGSGMFINTVPPEQTAGFLRAQPASLTL